MALNEQPQIGQLIRRNHENRVRLTVGNVYRVVRVSGSNQYSLPIIIGDDGKEHLIHPVHWDYYDLVQESVEPVNSNYAFLLRKEE